MNAGQLVRFLVAGQIREEFIINGEGRAFQSVLGGSLLYAAGSLSHWVEDIGLVGIISKEFPLAWRDRLRQVNLDTCGICELPEVIDQRAFFAYSQETGLLPLKPVAAYANAGLPVPEALLDYYPEDDSMRDMANIDFINKCILNLPQSYRDATLAHICPLNLDAQIQLTTSLQKNSVRIMSLCPHRKSMALVHWEKIPVLVKGLTGFITTEQEMRELFRMRSENLHEMMRVIGDYGCSCVVVRESRNACLLFITHSRKYYRIPDYDVTRLDPTGVMDAFCGGFLAGYSTSYDPVFASIQGNVAVSHKYEATGPFSIKESLPALSQVRFEQISLRVIEL